MDRPRSLSLRKEKYESEYELPPNLGDLMGAYDEAHWQTAVLELTPDKGILKRGTVLSMGGTGKLDATTAGNEAQVYGVLLDPAIDTAQEFSNGVVTGSVARASHALSQCPRP